MGAKNLFGIEELRKASNLFSSCNETFNQRFTAEQLIQLARMCWASEWDILPDAWTDQQVDLALKGVVPQWKDDETPLIPS